jgi:predicted CoA-substrate-specific enzyme activase
MVVAGVDVGAATAKAIIFNGKEIVGSCTLPTGHDIPIIAKQVMEAALEMAKLTMADVQYTTATGYGRNATPFANYTVTEIMCHAVGVNWVVPVARTVIDIGGQDSKAIRIDEAGRVLEFAMNDKCAAGTGRFLEVMARVLDLDIEEFADISLLSNNPLRISNVCTVFAESEVVGLRAKKCPREDIIAGLHKAAISRVVIMAKQVGIDDILVFSGGVAKNKAMIKALEDETGHKVVVPGDPQIIGALGAAIISSRNVSQESNA